MELKAELDQIVGDSYDNYDPYFLAISLIDDGLKEDGLMAFMLEGAYAESIEKKTETYGPSRVERHRMEIKGPSIEALCQSCVGDPEIKSDLNDFLNGILSYVTDSIDYAACPHEFDITSDMRIIFDLDAEFVGKLDYPRAF